MIYPKISIVTPSFNQARYLERTILSVINQQYPNLEYIIIDGGSDDGSVDIIRKYERHLAYWESNKDSGQYDAIRKGFEKCTGEVMGWINSDDVYHSGALSIVAEIFTGFPSVNWITGSISYVDEKDRFVKAYGARRWSRLNLFTGNYGWIQQESTFWRKSLWEKSGGVFNQKYSLAADFELWMRFFRIEKLYTTEALLGAFRVRMQNQKSRESIDDYLQELHEIIANEKLSPEELKRIKFIRLYEKFLGRIPLLKRVSFLKGKYEDSYNYPPLIAFNRENNSFELKK